MEKILCAAIWFDDGKYYPHQPININSGIVLCGFRHCSIFPQIGGLMAERKQLGIHEKMQGFITNKNRFVGRTEAYAIANHADQLKEDEYKNGSKLFSENLY